MNLYFVNNTGRISARASAGIVCIAGHTLWLFRNSVEKKSGDEDYCDGCDEYRRNCLLRHGCRKNWLVHTYFV